MTHLATLKVGARWGALVCLESEWVEAGEAQYWNYRLKCECGREVEVKRLDFPGKRYMRDCGECGAAALDGSAATLNVSMSVNLIEKIREVADKHFNGNFSRTVAAMIRAELKKEGIEVEPLSGWKERRARKREEARKEKERLKREEIKKEAEGSSWQVFPEEE